MSLTVELVSKGTLFVSFVALLSWYRQMEGLILRNGITPVHPTLAAKRAKWKQRSFKDKLSDVYRCPTLFWINSDDWFLLLVARVGLLVTLFGIINLIPSFLASFVFLMCYLSFIVVTRPWMGLQMHVTIIETNFVLILGHFCAIWNEFVLLFLFRFLVWRIMLGCGAVKYGTGDKSWRDGTAMQKHYYTQPIPNSLTHYFHHHPEWMLRWSVWATHWIEGPLTFLAFGNAWMRVLGFFLFAGLNVMINVSGNYGFLGILTVAQCLSLLDDDILATFLPFVSPTETTSWVQYLAFIPVLPYLLLSLVPLHSTFHGQIPWLKELQHKTHIHFSLDRFSPFQSKLWRTLEACHHKVSPLKLINRYAKFGSMSTWRGELVIECSDDNVNWHEYEFKYKPGNINKLPHSIPGHLPELDWMIWFLSSPARRSGANGLPDWYFSLLIALLEGRGNVLALLERVPIQRPKYIRTTLYNYTIPTALDRIICEKSDSFEQQVEVGRYWCREKLKILHKPLTLDTVAKSLFTGG